MHSPPFSFVAQTLAAFAKSAAFALPVVAVIPLALTKEGNPSRCIESGRSEAYPPQAGACFCCRLCFCGFFEVRWDSVGVPIPVLRGCRKGWVTRVDFPSRRIRKHFAVSQSPCTPCTPPLFVPVRNSRTQVHQNVREADLSRVGRPAVCAANFRCRFSTEICIIGPCVC
jgi:hypothetical protein